MSFVIAYVLLGLVTLVFVGIAHIWDRSGSWSSFLWRRRLMAALDDMNDAHRSWHDRLMAGVVVPLLTSLLIVVAWPAALVMGWRAWRQGRASAADGASLIDSDDRRYPPVLREHLLQRMTLEAVEHAELVTDHLCGAPCLPFGHLHAEWLAFKAALQPGAEVWHFHAPSKDWNLSSVRGYAGLREGQIGPVMYAVVCRRIV